MDLNILSGGDLPKREYASQVAMKECYVDSIIGNLKRRQQQAQHELDSTTAALKALENNPEVANVLELISKARS